MREKRRHVDEEAAGEKKFLGATAERERREQSHRKTEEKSLSTGASARKAMEKNSDTGQGAVQGSAQKAGHVLQLFLPPGGPGL